MTNLFEKSLLTGFGIFSLIIFILLISPFIQEVKNYEKKETDEVLDDFTVFINKVDNAIKEYLKSTMYNYLILIEIPKNINMSFINNFAKFDFSIENQIYSKVLNYDKAFIEKYYYNLEPGNYYLNISTSNSLTNIKFSIIEE